MDVQERFVFNAVQKVRADIAHFVLLEIPIKEHPSWNDSLVARVTVETVVISIELAEVCLTKYCVCVCVIIRVCVCVALCV